MAPGGAKARAVGAEREFASRCAPPSIAGAVLRRSPSVRARTLSSAAVPSFYSLTNSFTTLYHNTPIDNSETAKKSSTLFRRSRHREFSFFLSAIIQLHSCARDTSFKSPSSSFASPNLPLVLRYQLLDDHIFDFLIHTFLGSSTNLTVVEREKFLLRNF